MRTETEIRQKLKEIDDDGWLTGDILKSSVTHYLIKTCLLKWVLEEYEYPTKEEIKNIMMNMKNSMYKDPIVEDVRKVREDLAKEAGYDLDILLDHAEKAVDRIEKEYGIKWRRGTRVKEKLDTHTGLEKIKKDIDDFREILENIDFSLWTSERFSEVNTMFTMVEEDFADAERELREVEIENKELLSVFRKFMGIHIQFREMYFETRDIDIEHQFRWI